MAKKISKKYNFLTLGVLAIIVLALPISINLVQKNQENRSNASGYNDSKCEARNGKCLGDSKNVRQGDDCMVGDKRGSYVFNLCGGGSDRRCCVPDTSEPENNTDPSKTLKVGTFNIGNGHKHGHHDGSDFASELKKYKFDILGLQEAKTNLAKDTAEESGLEKVFSTYGSTIAPAGNAIISKKVLSDTSYKSLEDCAEARVLQRSVINVNNQNISFYNVHLDYHEKCRNKQAREVAKILKSDSNPWILTGDFNFGRSGCSTSDSIFGDGNEIIYDSNSGTRCTDMIIYSKGRGIKAVSSKTYYTAGKLSDHNIVSANFEVN